jgi:hypothetical protein
VVTAAGLEVRVGQVLPGARPTVTGALERPDRVWAQSPEADVVTDAGGTVLLRPFPSAQRERRADDDPSPAGTPPSGDRGPGAA